MCRDALLIVINELFQVYLILSLKEKCTEFTLKPLANISVAFITVVNKNNTRNVSFFCR